ncbi:MAG TPA: polysaccharide biosynthesis tyrosine autokinase [Mycobacteriales bacterium]|nr:polysaccharide biosynthesis tyrosine autokinase [Mycobacteriales bacterium]
MDLWGWVAILRRHVTAPLICIFAGTIGGLYFAYDTPKTYESTARVVVNVPTATELSQALAGAQLTATFVATYANVATSRHVADVAAQKLADGTTGAAISGKLSAAVETGTYLIDLTATDNHPARAQAIANAAADALTSVVQELQQTRAGADRISLEILDQATLPQRPVSPKPKQDIAIGVALGVVAGLALAALLEALDRTVRTTDQARTILPVPVLTVVPRHRRRSGIFIARELTSPVTESFRTLRTSVRYADRIEPARTLVVAGCVRHDGATSVAVNLAVAFALNGERVLLVDSDLRSGDLARLLGLSATVGLADVLQGHSPLAASVVEWGDVHVLPAGSRAGHSAEMLGSQEMTHLLQSTAGTYDVVILDAPPVLPTTDASVLAAAADGAILVVRAGSTPQQALAEAARRLRSVGARLLGQVVNAAPAREALLYSDRRAPGGVSMADTPSVVS